MVLNISNGIIYLTNKLLENFKINREIKRLIQKICPVKVKISQVLNKNTKCYGI